MTAPPDILIIVPHGEQIQVGRVLICPEDVNPGAMQFNLIVVTCPTKPEYYHNVLLHLMAPRSQIISV